MLDWIEWAGGDCPVPPSTCVQVEFRDGGWASSAPASYWRDGGDVFNCWKHVGSQSDIVAYCVVTTCP